MSSSLAKSCRFQIPVWGSHTGFSVGIPHRKLQIPGVGIPHYWLGKIPHYLSIISIRGRAVGAVEVMLWVDLRQWFAL
jgi:hypothetical protein